MRRGTHVQIYDAIDFKRGSALLTLESMLHDFADRELLLTADVPKLMARCTVTHSLEELVAGSSIIIECIPDALDVKQNLFAELGRVCEKLEVHEADILFWTNSMLLSVDCMTATMFPEKYRARTVRTLPLLLLAPLSHRLPILAPCRTMCHPSLRPWRHLRHFPPQLPRAPHADCALYRRHRLTCCPPSPPCPPLVPQVSVRFFAPCSFIDVVELMPPYGSVQLDGKRKVRNEPQEVRGRFVLNAHDKSWGYLMALAFNPVAYITGPRRILTEEEIILYWARQKARVEQNKTQDGDGPVQEVAEVEAPASSLHLNPPPYELPTSVCESTSVQTSECESTAGVSSSVSSSDAPENMCVICLSTEVNALIRPCGHTATCMRCAEGMWKDQPARCPICRMLMDSVLYASPDAIARSQAAAALACSGTTAQAASPSLDLNGMLSSSASTTVASTLAIAATA